MRMLVFAALVLALPASVSAQSVVIHPLSQYPAPGSNGPNTAWYGDGAIERLEARRQAKFERRVKHWLKNADCASALKVAHQARRADVASVVERICETDKQG
jgi:hypothetical protein